MWIEILTDDVSTGGKIVALRKESVDRNIWVDKTQNAPSMSLSARRVWIEIAVLELIPLTDPVALRKESVDRNIWVDKTQNAPSVALRKESVDRNNTQISKVKKRQGRSPQGECG